MKPSIFSVCFLFLLCICYLVYASCTACTEMSVGGSHIAARTGEDISDSEGRNQAQIYQANDHKAEVVSVSHFLTVIMGTGQFLLLCSVSPSVQHIVHLLKAGHKKTSCVTAEEHNAQRKSHATSLLLHVIWHMAGGLKK